MTWRSSPILGVVRVRPAAEHYRDVLGFHLDPEDGVFAPAGTGPDGVYAILEQGGAQIHLQIRRAPAVARTRGALDRDAYVKVDDLDAVHANLQARGARILSGPCMEPHGIREVVVEDLDGNRIAFGQFDA